MFSGLRNAIGDLFMLDLDSGKIENLTNDAFADYGPTFSPDGKYLVYMSRISGNEKLFRLDLDTKKKTQLTFGTHDDAQAKFVDDHTLVFPSTAVNPTVPIEPEVAKNGNVFNIWTLDMKTGELRQYTDCVGGNTTPIVLPDDHSPRVAFVTYFKGEYGVHTLERKDPLQTALVSDFGEPGQGPPVDFQPPLTHTMVQANKRTKKAVREDVPRRAAAGERRHHQRRRHLRRHADLVLGRARRQGDQLLRGVDFAVPGRSPGRT